MFSAIADLNFLWLVSFIDWLALIDSISFNFGKCSMIWLVALLPCGWYELFEL